MLNQNDRKSPFMTQANFMPKNYEEEPSSLDKKFLQLELFDPMRDQEDLR